jgi:hypothetical protein
MQDKDFKADIHSRTAADWTLENPFLPKNDLGVEMDTGRMKLGVGQRWASTNHLPPPGFVGFTNIVALTQAAYTALAVKDPQTLYIIT